MIIPKNIHRQIRTHAAQWRRYVAAMSIQEKTRKKWHWLTDCEEEKFAGPHNGEDAVNVVEDGTEDVVVALGRRQALGVKAGMDDAVHVEVEVVEFVAVRVRAGCIQKGRFVFDDAHRRTRVPFHQPSVERRYSHWFSLFSLAHSVFAFVSLFFCCGYSVFAFFSLFFFCGCGCG